MASLKSRHPFNLYYNAGEYVKICGMQDGYFPDFGHHLAGEMGGVWLHPIKLLDGFWLKVTDEQRNIAVYSKADSFINHPWGSEFHYDSGLGHIPIAIDRIQFVPELEKGFVAHYHIHNYAERSTTLKLELLVRTDLRPVWFSDQIGIYDGHQDMVERLTDRKVLVKDSEHDWYALIGTDLPGHAISWSSQLYGPEYTAGNGCGIAFSTEVTLASQEHFDFRLFTTGSYESREQCEHSYDAITRHHESLLKEKCEVYESVRHRSELTVEGEEAFNDIFAWTKWNTQWLVQRVDGIGRGLTAGAPNYPWWFGCDNTYSLQGVLAIGDHQLAKDTLRLIREKSEERNGNGRIIHEVTTMGAVANPGNTQETAHYIAMVWDLFRWTGDETVLQENYEYCLKGMDWLLGEMDPDGDLLPSGYGIIEIAGLNMELIDSAVYTAKAVQSLVKMSAYLKDNDKNILFRDLEERIVRVINDVYWQEEAGLYADAVASKKQILPKVDHLNSIADKHGITGYREYLEQELARAEDEELERGWILNKNWVIVTPMEVGIADPDKAKRALKEMRTDEFIGEYGTYLSGMFKQGIMTISTGVHAVAEAAYGNPDSSLELLRRMNSSFSRVLPGSFSEMSPDYGCIVQAWTIYALAVPVVNYFFGIEPAAYEKTVIVRPNLPKAWTGRRCTLNNLVIGDAEFDITLDTSDNGRLAEVRNPAGWLVRVEWNGDVTEGREAVVRLEGKIQKSLPI